MLGVNIPGINASSVTAFWSPWQSTSWRLIIEKIMHGTLKWLPRVLPPCEWRTSNKGRGVWELGVHPASLPSTDFTIAHKAQMWSDKGMGGKLKAKLSFCSEKKEFWDCQSAGPPFSPQQHCSGSSRHDTFPLSLSRGSNNDFYQLHDCCWGIQLLLSG